MGRAKYGSLSLRLDDSVKQATARTTANANAGVLRFAQDDKLKQATTTAATTATTAPATATATATAKRTAGLSGTLLKFCKLYFRLLHRGGLCVC
jgi:hypothetical protein